MKNQLRFLVFMVSILVSVNTSIAQWIRTNGPYGGGIRDVFIATSGNIFVANWIGGVYRSDDNGLTWKEKNNAINGVMGNNVHCLVQNSQGHLFLGTWGSGLFRSTNNGDDWEKIWWTDCMIYKIAVDANGNIYVGTNRGLFLSTDNGLNLQEIAFANYIVQSLAINQAGHIFAGVQDVIYRSTDNGVNWTAVSNSMTNTTISSIVIDPTGQIFACAYPLYRSTDNGDTWVETGSGINHVYSIAFNSIGQLFLGTEYGVFRLTNNEEIWETVHLGFDGIHVRSVSITSGDKIFIGTDRGLFSSADNGNSWTESNSGLYNPTQTIFVDNGGNLFAGAVGGFFRSVDNGDSWFASDNGLQNFACHSYAINEDGDIFVGCWGVVSKSTDNGTTWTTVKSGLNIVWAVSINSQGYIYVGIEGGGVIRSTDNGESWQATGLTNVSVHSIVINSIGQIFAGTNNGVYRSADNGVNWQLIGLANTYISTLAIDAEDQIFTSVWLTGVFRSTDNGENWTLMNSEIAYNFISTLVIHSDGYLFALGNGVFVSTNAGEVWENVSTGLYNNYVNALTFNSSNQVFIGTTNGVWSRPLSEMVTVKPIPVVVDIHPGSEENPINIKSNGKVPVAIKTENNFNASTVDMATVKFGPNKTSVIKGCLEDIDGDGDLDLLMHFDNEETGITKTDTSAGIIGKTKSGLDIQGSDHIKIVGKIRKESHENEIGKEVPSMFSLSQNYPNPFNPVTTLKFSLSQEGFTTIKIYNSIGQEVAQLISQYLNSGNYSVEWNASDFSSGVYYYIINAGRFTETKKLLLLK